MNIIKSNKEGNIQNRELAYVYGMNCFTKTISHMPDISEINNRLYAITIKIGKFNKLPKKLHHISEEIYKAINMSFDETSNVNRKYKNGLFIDFDVEGSRLDKFSPIDLSENVHFHGLIAVSKEVYDNRSPNEIIDTMKQYINEIYNNRLVVDVYIDKIDQNKPFISYISYSSKFSYSYANQNIDFTTKCYPFDLPSTRNKKQNRNDRKLRIAKKKANIILDEEISVFTDCYKSVFFNYHYSNKNFYSYLSGEGSSKTQINKYVEQLFG